MIKKKDWHESRGEITLEDVSALVRIVWFLHDYR
jgi:hypothetical protein